MQNLNCNQVIALLTFFIDNRLNSNLMQSVEYHINICPLCREKFLNLKKMLDNYEEIKNKIIENDNSNNKLQYSSIYKNFKENLSAYIDNELSDNENLRIRKLSIVNTTARQDLEDLLTFKSVLKESVEKTKNNFKSDLSEKIIKSLYNNKNSNCNNKKYIQFLSFVLIALLFIGALIYKFI